jgi:hypothetical protein
VTLVTGDVFDTSARIVTNGKYLTRGYELQSRPAGALEWTTVRKIARSSNGSIADFPVPPVGTWEYRVWALADPQYGAGTVSETLTLVSIAPTVTSLTPDRGPVSGGTLVTIVTTLPWSQIEGVKFGDRWAYSEPAEFQERPNLQVTAPPGTPGEVDVTVYGWDGDSQVSVLSPFRFTYLPDEPTTSATGP